MLKRLAIVGVLLTLASASFCLLAGQTAPLSSQKEGITKADGGRAEKNIPKPPIPTKSTPSLTASGVEIEAAPCDEACQQGRRNLEIQGKLEWFTGVLAVVGVLQVIAGGLQIGTMVWQARLLKGTLTEIQTQAKHIGAQTTAAQKAAEAAELSAKAAMGTSVPWLALVKFSFVVIEGQDHPLLFYQHPHVKLVLKNFGQSPALLKQYGSAFRWDDVPVVATNYFFDAEAIIDPGGTYPMDEAILDVDMLPPADVVADLVKGTRTLIFSFWVTYGDVFGSPTKRFEFEKHLVEYDPNPEEMMVVDLKNVEPFGYAAGAKGQEEKQKPQKPD